MQRKVTHPTHTVQRHEISLIYKCTFYQSVYISVRTLIYKVYPLYDMQNSIRYPHFTKGLPANRPVCKRVILGQKKQHVDDLIFLLTTVHSGPKKLAHFVFYALSSSNIDRFSSFFRWLYQENRCNRIVTRIPPHIKCVATLPCEMSVS